MVQSHTCILNNALSGLSVDFAVQRLISGLGLRCVRSRERGGPSEILEFAEEASFDLLAVAWLEIGGIADSGLGLPNLFEVDDVLLKCGIYYWAGGILAVLRFDFEEVPLDRHVSRACINDMHFLAIFV